MKRYLAGAIFSGVMMFGMGGMCVQAQSKPGVTILATGGTIAGSAASATDTTGYQAGTLGIDVLINAVPQMASVADVKGEQISNIVSSDINPEILLNISRRVNELLTTGGQHGVVITHGTDTTEETAFFLSLTVKSEQPVVVVGAMRPATAISADGPMNLLEAVTLAASPSAKGRGVMIVLNDRIGSAYYTSKTNSTMVDAFAAHEQGYLGVFISGNPKFFYKPVLPTNQHYFDVSQIESLPYVEIIYAYQNQGAELLNAAVENGAKGIVVAVSGNGGVSAAMIEGMKALMARGIPVIMATKTGSGYTTSRDYGIGSGFFNPVKSRILLQLAIATGADIKQIEAYFGQ